MIKILQLAQQALSSPKRFRSQVTGDIWDERLGLKLLAFYAWPGNIPASTTFNLPVPEPRKVRRVVIRFSGQNATATNFPFLRYQSSSDPVLPAAYSSVTPYMYVNFYSTPLDWFFPNGLADQVMASTVGSGGQNNGGCIEFWGLE